MCIGGGCVGGETCSRDPLITRPPPLRRWSRPQKEERQREREREGRRPNAFLGLSLNDGTILFLALLRYVFRRI